MYIATLTVTAGTESGTMYIATLTVTAGTESVSDTYRVIIKAKTLDIESDVAIDEALWWLYKRQNRYTSGGIDYGYDAVRRGLNYLTSKMHKVTVPADDGDTNGNGFGIACYDAYSHEMYEIGIAMMAIVSSDTPGKVAVAGPSGVVGRTYREIVQDMADFCAYAQNDGGFKDGGWRYQRNYSSSDNSGYGGFGYTSACSWVNIAKTAGTGITGFLFCGVPVTDSRVQNAINFIDTNWGSDNFGNIYAMYGVKKAFEEFLGMENTGSHIWYDEYARYLVDRQQSDGRWNTMKYGQSNELTTAWAVLILRKGVYDIPPSAVASEV